MQNLPEVMTLKRELPASCSRMTLRTRFHTAFAQRAIHAFKNQHTLADLKSLDQWMNITQFKGKGPWRSFATVNVKVQIGNDP